MCTCTLRHYRKHTLRNHNGYFICLPSLSFNFFFPPLKTELILYKYAGSDGGANVLGTVLGHGLLWNPQASELLCVLSIPGGSEGIPD